MNNHIPYIQSWILILHIVLVSLSPSAVFAHTAQPTPITSVAVSPTPAENLLDKLKQIKILKEKIATKVAEMRENEMTATSGTVKTIEAGSVTIQSVKGERRITMSEDVQVYLLSDKGRSPSDTEKMKQGDTVSAIGYVETGKHVLVASYIYIQNQTTQHFSGTITEIDRENFTITVKGKQMESLVDIEKYTRTMMFDRKQDAMVRTGFSKLTVGNTVHVTATPNTKEENRYSALRIASLSFNSETQSNTTTTPDKTASASPSKITTPLPTEKPVAVTKTPTPPKSTDTPKPTL